MHNRRPLSALSLIGLALLPILARCAVPLCSASALPIRDRSVVAVAPRAFVSPRSLVSLSVRGGAAVDDDDDGYDEDDYGQYDDEDEEGGDGDGSEVEPSGDEGGEGGADLAVAAARKVLRFLGRATVETFKGLRRAVEAGLSSEDVDEDEEDASILTKTGRVISRMVRAAFSPPSAEDEEGAEEDEEEPVSDLAKSVKKKVSNADLASSVRKKSSKTAAEDSDDPVGDFGAYLAHAYGVAIDADDEQEEGGGEGETVVASAKILGGSLGDALRSARAQARLLVVFIPSSPPASKRKIKSSTSYDEIAIRGLLSRPVSAVAERKARKKEEWGSFVLWSAKAGSPEAAAASKRLKVKPPGKGKGGTSPVLLVAYAAQVLDSSGRPKLVPRILAQHHCNPPPTPETMAAWLNALRKRHAKQYAAMHHGLREARLFKERTEGYRNSLKDDKDREEREQREEEERLAKEEAERERKEALERRREELLRSLPQEPDESVPNVVTIALRFADGRTGQRRFADYVDMDVVFNWVDAMYGVERERVELSTMNGQKRFAFEGEDGERTTLKNAGLGKMTGLRVSVMKAENGDNNKEEGEDAGVQSRVQ